MSHTGRIFVILEAKSLYFGPTFVAHCVQFTIAPFFVVQCGRRTPVVVTISHNTFIVGGVLVDERKHARFSVSRAAVRCNLNINKRFNLNNHTILSVDKYLLLLGLGVIDLPMSISHTNGNI